MGQPHELRRARIRHGRHHERHRAAWRLHPLRRHLFDLQRLQPQRDPHGGADENPRDSCVHPRQHWPGRRRPDAPERGAHPQLAHHSGAGRVAPGRWPGNGCGLGLCGGAQGRPQRAVPVTPEPAAPEPTSAKRTISARVATSCRTWKARKRPLCRPAPSWSWP